MGVLGVAALLLAICLSSCSADWADGNDGIDRMNGDLPNMPIQMKTGAAPKDCAQLCYASGQCKAWAYAKPSCNGSTSTTPQCSLKDQVTQQSVNPCRVRHTTDRLFQRGNLQIIDVYIFKPSSVFVGCLFNIVPSQYCLSHFTGCPCHSTHVWHIHV